MKMMKSSVEKSVFDEYIRCNLFNRICRSKGNCSANKATENRNFEDCICVPVNIYVFTRKFFFLKKELEKCSCPVFGSNSREPKAGYTVYDSMDLTEKSTSISNLFILMGTTPNYSNKNEIFAMLLCTYLGEIINQYNIRLELPTFSGFSTMIDSIDEAYRGTGQDADELLCIIYFYICVCIRGSDTFNPHRLYSIFNGIFDYSKSSAKKICEDLDGVVEGVKQKKSYFEILKNQPHNYLACVCIFLEFLYSKLDSTCNFRPIIEHVKTAFVGNETKSPFAISNLIQKLKEISMV